MKSTLNRRQFVFRALGSAGALHSLAHASADSTVHGDENPILVLVQLSGGNDGLSMIVPHGDDDYHGARRSIRWRAEDVLPIDDYRGWNGELEQLAARYSDGGVALIEGVGYARPNRSHFKSYEIWHTGDERGRAAGDGWIGRLCAEEFGAKVAANRVIHVGSRVPYSLFSTLHPAASFTVPAGYRWVGTGDSLAAFSEPEATGNDALAFVRRRMQDARASSAAVRGAVVRYSTPVEYPATRFGTDLRAVAALANGRIGTRVLSIELGGFDTHNDQRRRHDELMRTLDRGLGAFQDDLERTEAGRRVITLVFSEFGRRVAENGSRGTDHGCAGPMLALGARVNGGLFGAHPSLSELDDGDLIYTTDFRSVYADAIEACFETSPQRVLGAHVPRLGLFG